MLHYPGEPHGARERWQEEENWRYEDARLRDRVKDHTPAPCENPAICIDCWPRTSG